MRSADVIDHTEENRAALAAVDSLSPAVFIIGRAGTGKTRLLREIAARADRQTAIVAPTGLAALNAGGQTIHALFGIPPFGAGPNIDPRRLKRSLLRKLDLILVDEVSMVRADLMDAMDQALRTARRTDAPFGDVQMVFFGDFLQLPPVVTGQDGMVLQELGYRSPYAFDAHVFGDLHPDYVELQTVHRQSDEEFVRLLGRIRAGEADAAEDLNARCVGPHRTGATPVLLTATNRLAETYNMRGLDALPGPPAVFEGRIRDKFQRDRLPAPQALPLKPGARVMAVRNDPQMRFVNGSLGTVTHSADGAACVRVRFDGAGDAVDVEPVTWDSVRYDLDAGKVTTSVVGSYQQLPLAPAWAITVHKSQGLTLDNVRVDLGRGAFAPGQAYVALSRCRTLEGLSLARPLTGQDLMRDPALERFW